MHDKYSISLDSKKCEIYRFVLYYLEQISSTDERANALSDVLEEVEMYINVCYSHLGNILEGEDPITDEEIIYCESINDETLFGGTQNINNDTVLIVLHTFPAELLLSDNVNISQKAKIAIEHLLKKSSYLIGFKEEDTLEDISKIFHLRFLYGKAFYLPEKSNFINKMDLAFCIAYKRAIDCSGGHSVIFEGFKPDTSNCRFLESKYFSFLENGDTNSKEFLEAKTFVENFTDERVKDLSNVDENDLFVFYHVWEKLFFKYLNISEETKALVAKTFNACSKRVKEQMDLVSRKNWLSGSARDWLIKKELERQKGCYKSITADNLEEVLKEYPVEFLLEYSDLSEAERRIVVKHMVLS